MYLRFLRTDQAPFLNVPAAHDARLRAVVPVNCSALGIGEAVLEWGMGWGELGGGWSVTETEFTQGQVLLV